MFVLISASACGKTTTLTEHGSVDEMESLQTISKKTADRERDRIVYRITGGGRDSEPD